MENLKKPAVFFDRDGTLIAFYEKLTTIAQLELLPGAAEAVADLKHRGFLVFGITNQPIIEKGELTLEASDAINGAMQEMLKEAGGAELDKIYTCPHKYRQEGQCECRKPGQKLLEDAEREFSIDRERSWFVGDRLRDVETGKRAGFKTILVQTGGPSKDDEFFPNTEADFVVGDLNGAVSLIK